LSVGEQTRASDFLGAALRDPARCGPGGLAFANCAAFAEINEATGVRNLTRLRTWLDVALPARLRARLVYDHEFSAGDLDTFEAGLADGFAADRLVDAEGRILSSSHARWRHLLYRAWLRYEGDSLELTLGRQRIAWGVGRLWNPIDRLNAIGPLALEPDQSTGVDAVDLRWNLDGFDYFELVYAPGRHRRDDRYAARVHATRLDTDVSVMGGFFEEAPTAGFDLARNLGDAAVRLETVWTRPERKVRPVGATAARAPDDFWQAVVSIDNNFDVGSGLYVLFEHLYNGNALGFGRGLAGPFLAFFQEGTPPRPASRAIFGTSQVVSFGRFQSGVQLGYDWTPELRIEPLVIVDWEGGSVLLFPTVHYTPTGSFDLTLGAQIGVGGRLSDYGSSAALGYLLAEFYF